MYVATLWLASHINCVSRRINEGCFWFWIVAATLLGREKERVGVTESEREAARETTEGEREIDERGRERGRKAGWGQM